MTHTLAYVAKVFPRTSETFVINELRALEELGERPVVFSLHRNPSPVAHAILEDLEAPVFYADDIEVDDRSVRRAVEQLAAELGIRDEDRGVFLPRKYVRLALALRVLVERHGVRHMHAHFASRSGHVAALSARLTGIGYSMTAHAKDIYHHDVDAELLKWKIRNARFVVTVTDFNYRHLVDLLGRDDPALRQLVRLYNGVDLAMFHAANRPVATPPVIVSVGRLVEKKGFDILVDACGILRDEFDAEFRCEIIGGGELEQSLRKQVYERGLEDVVRFSGSLPTEAVVDRLRASSMVALPCIVAADGNVDALPTALLEGMACGLPLVSTRLSGIPEIVADGENGLLVEPGDARQLASAMATLLSDPVRASAMGAAGRRRAEELFDLRRNVATLKAMFARVSASGNPVA